MNLPAVGENIMPRVSFGESLVELAEQYPDMVVFDADVCASTQTVKFRDAYPARFFQMGIAEANIVCTTAGMATLRFTPFVSAFAVFLAKRSLDQIRVSVAYPKLNVKLNGSYGGLPTGKAGATHSSVEDIAVMRCMPNMTVLVPGDPLETKLSVELALKTEGPVYLRTVRCPVPVIFGKAHRMELGKGHLLHDGEDIALVSTGMMTPKSLAAVESLAKEGINVRLIHMGTIKPLDKDIIVKAARECGRIVTVENHSVLGGLGGAVSEALAEECPCRVHRIGFPDIFMESGDDEAVFSKLKMNTEDIKDRIRSILNYSRV